MGVIAHPNGLTAELTSVEAGNLIPAGSWHGRLRNKSGVVTVADGDSNGSVFRFFRMRSTDRIQSIEVTNSQSFSSGTDWDTGLYTINGGAAVDADRYADGHTLHTPGTFQYRFGPLGVAAVTATTNTMIWEDLGATSDTGLEYDFAMTGNTIGTQGGTLWVRVQYTSGD